MPPRADVDLIRVLVACSCAQVALRPAQVLEDRRVLLFLRRQLNLSDTLSTAQLRLLYGTEGAKPGDKRRARVLQLLKEVEQKLDDGKPPAPTDGLTVAQLLERAVKVAARVQRASNAVTLDKWGAVPIEERKAEPVSPWTTHVMQQERARHVNRWSAAATTADGGGTAGSGTSVFLEAAAAPAAENAAENAESDAEAAAAEAEQVADAPERDPAAAEAQATAVDDPSGADSTVVIVEATLEPLKVPKEAAAPPPPELKRGRVAAWRCDDAARDVKDEASVVAALDEAAAASARPSPKKRPGSAAKTPTGVRGVSSRLYPATAASPSRRGSGNESTTSTRSRRHSRTSGSASLSSLSAASVNSSSRRGQSISGLASPKQKRRSGNRRQGIRQPGPQTPSQLQSPARKTLSKLEQTLAKLAVEADELLAAGPGAGS